MSASTNASTVTVYNYWVADGSSDHCHVSPAKAPLETIEKVLRSSPLMGTAQEVESQELDQEGSWRRRAIGWGATS